MASLHLTDHADDAVNGFSQNLKAYMEVTRAARSFHYTKGSVSRLDWKKYNDNVRLAGRYKGLEGFSFIRRVKYDELAEFELSVREDKSVDPAGYPEFAIRPPGTRDEYFVIEYIEPFNEVTKKAIGYDLGSESKRRAALDHAVLSGEPTASAPIRLVTRNEEVNSLLIVEALYSPGLPISTDAEKKSALYGYVVTALHGPNFVLETIGEAKARPYNIEIYDGDWGHTINSDKTGHSGIAFYSDYTLKTNGALPPSAYPFEVTKNIDVAGRKWTLHFQSNSNFEDFDWRSPLVILCSGIVASLSLFGVAWLQVMGRKRAIALAETITEELREKEKRYHILFEKGSDTMIVYTFDENGVPGKFVEVNEAACRNLGYTKKELLNLSPQDISCMDTYTLASEMEKFFREGQMTIECLHKTKDGKSIPIEVNSQIFDLSGKRAALAIARDITKRKKVEEALLESYNKMEDRVLERTADLEHTKEELEAEIAERKRTEIALKESEERFRMLSEASFEGIVIHEKGKILDLNTAATKLTGYTEEELLGGNAYDLLTPESRDAAFKNMAANYDKPYEVAAKHKDGSIIPLEIHAKSAHLWGHEARIVALRDITERKRTEAILRESEQRFRLMADSAPVMIWMADEDGVCGYFNHIWEEFTGLSINEPKVDKWAAGVHPDDQEKCSAIYSASIQERKPFRIEYRMKRFDGEYRWVLDTGIPRVTRDGLFAGFIGSCVDITELKNSEQKMLESKNRAEDATKLKDKFVSLVAHDLKSPFGSMMGLLNFLYDDPAAEWSPSQKNILEHVLTSGNLMIKMIDEILNISRLQTGKIKPDCRFVDGFFVVSLAVSRYASLAEQKGIQIINEVPEGTRLYADMNLFNEVIQNLVSNAVKFCKSGDQIVIFRPDNAPSTIAVKDTGIGVPKEYVSKLFRHEEKTSMIGTGGEMGTGLGLPLSHDIMEAHGGELYVESEEGRGSVFYAELPAVTPVILLVDDERVQRYIIREQLRPIQAEIIEAANGEEALRMIEERRPHLVVADIMMPIMDGYELIEKIKGDPKTRSIPVIVITADSKISTREKAIRLGADDFATKPTEIHDFLPRIRRFLA